MATRTRKPKPAEPEPDSVQIDVNVMIRDLSEQVAAKSVEAAQARAVASHWRRQYEQLAAAGTGPEAAAEPAG